MTHARRLSPSTRPVCLCGVALLMTFGARAQEPPRAAELLSAQREALAPLAAFDGLWRGPAKVVTAEGRTVEIVQTERVGPLLSRTLRSIEGRGYGPDGALLFNAYAVISYSPQAKTYDFHSYAQGHAGDFPLEVGPDRFAWTLQAGPATIRYSASVADGVWTEVGERLVAGQPPQRIFEMRLQRLGPTDWPEGGAVAPR